MRSKIALFLAALLFFNIILPTKVFAASVQDQSKPIFGLTADQVVEKYNQLTDQQKDQVLRSLGNTSIFANSLFGNIFNSTFGVLDDAIVKIGDLFFQANGVIYKLGSSALAWVSRLIDKVFNNDLTDINISQPVIDDLYLNTRFLEYTDLPLFTNGYLPDILGSYKTYFDLATYKPSSPYYTLVCRLDNNSGLYGFSYDSSGYLSNPLGQHYRLVVDLDNSRILFTNIGFYTSGDYILQLGSYAVPSYYFDYGGYWKYAAMYPSNVLFVTDSIREWRSTTSNYNFTTPVISSVTEGNYLSLLKTYLYSYFNHADSYVLIKNGFCFILPITSDSDTFNITNNTYYNYIYNIPVQTPLNVTNIVSNTAINYDPVENLIQYLPDNYNIEQNFSVVNNYYISSSSAITGQAIDVNIVSPSVIDVRVINPEDLTQQVTNNVSKDIINNTDVNFGDLDFSPSITVGLNAAKDSIEGIVPVTGSSIVAQFVSGIPPDWLALGFVFFILFIAAGFGMSIIRH